MEAQAPIMEAQAPTTTTTERRRHRRTQLQMTIRSIRLDPDAGDPLDTLHMVDISRGGLGAYVDRPFYPGQRVVLCLPLSNNGGRRNIYATAVRCRPEEDGYRVGLAFDTASMGASHRLADRATAA